MRRVGMRLLVLIHRLPCPADRGSKLRAAAELRYLARRHDVWCAGFLDPADSPETRRQTRLALAEWNRLCREVLAVPLRRPVAAARALTSLAGGATATEGYFHARRLQEQVLRWSWEVGFDAVLAFSSSMAPLALQVPAGRRVLDLVDLDSRKWSQMSETARWPMRWVYREEGRRLATRELDWIRAFDASVLVNEREAALLAEAGGDDAWRERGHVIETGAWPDPDTLAAKISPDGQFALTDEPNIGFIGAMDYAPNVEAVRWFARSVLPLVRARRPEAAFWIVGRSPVRSVTDLDDGSSIRVTGTVPAVEPYLAHLRVSVAPLRLARGVQTKVLVAMAAGVPCVVTPCVAEGIGARPGSEIVVAETPDDFAWAVQTLLSDQAQARSIGNAGRRFVARRFSSEGLDRLEALLAGQDWTAAAPRGQRRSAADEHELAPLACSE